MTIIKTITPRFLDWLAGQKKIEILNLIYNRWLTKVKVIHHYGDPRFTIWFPGTTESDSEEFDRSCLSNMGMIVVDGTDVHAIF